MPAPLARGNVQCPLYKCKKMSIFRRANGTFRTSMNFYRSDSSRRRNVCGEQHGLHRVLAHCVQIKRIKFNRALLPRSQYTMSGHVFRCVCTHCAQSCPVKIKALSAITFCSTYTRFHLHSTSMYPIRVKQKESSHFKAPTGWARAHARADCVRFTSPRGTSEKRRSRLNSRLRRAYGRTKVTERDTSARVNVFRASAMCRRKIGCVAS